VKTIAGRLRTNPVTGAMMPETGKRDGTGTDSSFAFPQGLWVGPKGTVYVADANNNAIRRLKQKGSFQCDSNEPYVVSTMTLSVHHPIDLTVSPKTQKMYVTISHPQRHMIYEIDAYESKFP
jgi:DNA-binding beta-propeller fold protein YncE